MMIRNDYIIYIALYIDDLLIISENNNDFMKIKRRLIKKFEIKNLNITRKFLEMKIKYNNNDSIKLYQDQYIQNLLKYHDI